MWFKYPKLSSELIHVFEARLNARKSVREREQNLVINGHNIATIDLN